MSNNNLKNKPSFDPIIIQKVLEDVYLSLNRVIKESKVWCWNSDEQIKEEK
ncbi:hypothetical protein [Bacillus aerius]|uniref:Uncharacterized protein n=1 Tax=Bacillus aerius TaxID=293388 RepID=A0AB39J9C1_9BACI